MATPSRIERLGKLLQVEVAEIIDNRLTDPNIGHVTVTGVRVSKDIKYADVYVSVEGDEKSIGRSLLALKRSRGYIQRIVAARVVVKQIPILRFHFDKGFASALRVFELLREIGETDKGR